MTADKRTVPPAKLNSEPPPQPRLIILSAPSGAGKSTLCERLIKEFPKICLSISTTTRGKRDYEKEGVHYHFVTREQFDKKVAEGAFAEWAEVHGNRYGTAVSTIDNFLKQGKHVLFDIDVQGAMNLRKRYGQRTLLIFVHPPSMEELKARLMKRKSESSESIETRMRNAYNEVRWSGKFDHQLTNDHLDRAYEELKQIIQKECL